MANLHRYFRYFTYIEPVIRTPVVRTYGSLILNIIVISIFVIFAIKPTVETILLLQKKLADSKEILAKITQKGQNLSLGTKNYQALDQETKDKIRSSISLSPELGELTKSLENVAKVSQASLSAIQFQTFTINKPSVKQTLAEIPFIYNIEGSYQTLLLVLDNLRQMDRVVSVDHLTIAQIEGGGTLLLSVSGKAYYLK